MIIFDDCYKRQFEESKRLETMPFLQLEIPTEQISPLFEIELDLCDGDTTDSLYKIVKLKNLGNGTATNIIYSWTSKGVTKPPRDYQPINAIMAGDSYNFQLTFNVDNAIEGVSYGTLIWQFDDLLGNSYEQRWNGHETADIGKGWVRLAVNPGQGIYSTVSLTMGPL